MNCKKNKNKQENSEQSIDIRISGLTVQEGRLHKHSDILAPQSHYFNSDIVTSEIS